MSNESAVFSGNAYIFFPCWGGGDKEIVINNFFSNSDYLECLSSRSNEEIGAVLQEKLRRTVLGDYNIPVFDEKEEKKREYVTARLFLTYSAETDLAVATLAVFGEEFDATQLLDRMTQDRLILFALEGEAEGRHVKSVLEDFGLEWTSPPKACLSTGEEVSRELREYYLAGETFGSENMSSGLVSEQVTASAERNIAEYDRSDIYAGKNVILRMDKKATGGRFPDINSDVLLTCIAEVLVLKEASVVRTNDKVVDAISNRADVGLDSMIDMAREFGKGMPLWDSDVFRYITAQNLSNSIEDAFGVSSEFDKYFKNQEFLEYSVSLRQSLMQRSEDRVLYLIAAVLFVFDAGPWIYKVLHEIFYGSVKALDAITFSSASLVTVSIVLFIKIYIKRSRKSRGLI